MYKCTFSRIRYLLFFEIVAFTCLCIFISFHDDDDNDENYGMAHNKHMYLSRLPQLRYIPDSSLALWKERDFLVVVGIPSEDSTLRRSRRNLQRGTCWTFPGVATRSNAYMGAMLILYIVTRHPNNRYDFSSELKKEAKEWHDVAVLDVREGKKTTRKRVGMDGSWGPEAEIVMSKKTFLWFQLALVAFPQVNFITKADDDIFLVVPQYLVDLKSLPRRRTYWGALGHFNTKKGGMDIVVYFIIGFCSTLARDVVEQVVSSKDLQSLVHLPYNNKTSRKFMSLTMDHEDAMVGQVLLKQSFPTLFVAEKWPCRFHTLGRRNYGALDVSSKSLVIHRLEEKDYEVLMTRFRDVQPHPANAWEYIGRFLIRMHC